MTRPTSEQIKALRKGDVVTVRAVVYKAAGNGDAFVAINFEKALNVHIKPSEIMTIEPREIKVGDRVTDGFWSGVAMAVCDGRVWVRYDHNEQQGKAEPFLCDEKAAAIQVIP